MTQTTLNRLIDQALKNRGSAQWLESHQAELGAEFIRAATGRADTVIHADAHGALALADLAVSAAAVLDDPAMSAVAARGKAQALHQSGACKEAIPLYKQASAFYRRAGDHLNAARSLIGAIDALGYLGQTAEALEIAEGCRSVFKNHGEDALAAKVDLNVGNLYHRLDRNREAGDYYRRARRVFARSGLKRLCAMADTNLGNVATNLCDYAAARRHYRRAARTLDQVGDGIAGAMNDFDLGWLHFVEGDYTRALAILHRIKRVFEERDLRRHVATCDADLAEIHLQLNNLEEAERAARGARSAFQSLNFRVDAARCAMMLGILECRQGKLDESEELLRDALATFRSEGSRALELTATLQLADIFMRRGDVTAAADAAADADGEFGQLGLSGKQAYAAVVLGGIREAQGDLQAARSHFEKARELGQALASHPVLIEAFCGLGRIERCENGPSAAIPLFEAARDSLARVRSMLHPEELKTRFLDDKGQVYADLVECILEAGGEDAVSRALEVVEEAKSRALVDMLVGRLSGAGRRSGDEALAQRIRALQQELSALLSAVERHERNGGQRALGLASELRDRIDEREAELDRCMVEMELENAEYASLINPPRMSFQRVQQLVPIDGALIEFFSLRESMLAFVVTTDDVRVVPLGLTSEEARTAADDLGFEMARAGWSPDVHSPFYAGMCESIDRRLESLYTSLIAPLSELPRRLIFIPHGALHSVPFQALKGPEGYLIDEHEVSYAPNASVLQFCLERGASDVERALVVGVKNEDLPFIDVELKDVKSQFPVAKLLTGKSASKSQLRKFSADYDVIHIASHGAFRESKPMFSGVRLADGWLSVRDVYDLKLNASLATLSACQTGMNSVSRADELVGLVRGFLYAGAPAVLASQWTVNDNSTADFMRSFYGALCSGASRGAALRTAQLELKSTYRHPYHWAPFILVGAWQ